MITLDKTHKPLHTMTDDEVSEAIRRWERAADNHLHTPDTRFRFECRVNVLNGERLRRIESVVRSWH
jgi:hypothetical protein